MTQTLYLLQNQNNYFNRKVILQGVRTLEEIQNNEKLISVHNNINVGTFDSLTCNIIINTDYNFGVVANVPDYAVINSVRDDGTEELTRWFVDTYSKVRGEQYAISLKRDVLADYLGTILVSPCFIEKGFASRDNPLIYNNEGMTFNQIRIGETKIKDNKAGPYIVGYIARSEINEQGQRIPYSLSVDTDASSPQGDITSFDSLPSTIQSAIDRGNIYLFGDTYQISYLFYKHQFGNVGYSGVRRDTFLIDSTTKELISHNLERTDSPTGDALFEQYITRNGSDEYSTLRARLINNLPYEVMNQEAEEYISNNINLDRISVLDAYNNFVYKRGNNYYRLVMEYVEDETFDLTINNNNALQMALISTLENTSNEGHELKPRFSMINIKTPSTGLVSLNCKKYKITNVSVSGVSVRATIPETRAKLKDSAYDMFVIPFYDYKVWWARQGVFTSYNCTKEAQLDVANALTEALGSRLYDIQLLPYMPLGEVPISETDSVVEHRPQASNLVLDSDYTIIYETSDGALTDVIKGIIYFPNQSKRRFAVELNIDRFTNDSYEVKVRDATEMYRISSPNYNGIYEFSIQKNGGTLKSVNIDIDYKPYQPFIRLSLHYGGINTYRYSDRDMIDARGLICNGDFSLAQINSAWTDYQINNKNFQEMFDRDIKNLEIKQQIAREQLIYKNTLGVVGSTGAGAMAGFRAGGISGAVVGAYGGALASIPSTLLQTRWQEAQQKEDISYEVDKFTYQLENVQAIPYSLTKVSAITSVFKNFPILEHYTSTDREKEAFRNKLHYEGMTIMVVSTIQEYCDINDENYIKGKLIRLEDASIDNNIAKAIYDEVNKGFYIDIGGYTSGN